MADLLSFWEKGLTKAELRSVGEDRMTSEVGDLLKALSEGHMTLDQVAQRFRERKWPTRRPRPDTYAKLAKAELEDPEPYIPGSFDDVTLAYHRGDLSDQQYDVLASAMADAMEAAEDH